MVERAIQTQYRIMIEHTIAEIKKGLSTSNKAVHSDTPVDIVIAGGTSSPPGFDKMFRDTIMQAKLPIKIGDVIRPEDPLYSVARGCLIAAENAR
jgi:actin-related protein